VVDGRVHREGHAGADEGFEHRVQVEDLFEQQIDRDQGASLVERGGRGDLEFEVVWDQDALDEEARAVELVRMYRG